MTAKKWLDRGVYLSSMLISSYINRGKDAKALNFKNILCIKEDEIGDFIYTLPVYSMLRKQYPNAQITVLCRPFGVHILTHCPDINRAISDYKLLENQYDLLVDLRGTVASTRLAFTKKPIYRLDRGTQRIKNRKSGIHPHEMETNWSIIQPLIDEKNKDMEPKIHLSSKEIELADEFIKTNQIGRFALFHTGARRILKKWPLDRVVRIMKWIHQDFGYDCVLVGDVFDANDAEEIQSQLDFKLHIAAGKINLLGFAALCQKAELFMGNDSGPLHIATAMGTASVGLYGPGDPIFHPRKENATFIHHILECNPCDQVHCKYKSYPCIQRITEEEVKDKIKFLWNL